MSAATAGSPSRSSWTRDSTLRCPRSLIAPPPETTGGCGGTARTSAHSPAATATTCSGRYPRSSRSSAATSWARRQSARFWRRADSRTAPGPDRCLRSGRHVLLEPGDEPGQVVRDGREPADTVTLLRVDHQFRVDAMTHQCLVELPGLAVRRAPVLGARCEQGRCPGLARVHNRTARVHLVADLLGVGVVQEPQSPAGDVGSEREAVPLRYRRARHGGLESLVLG